MQSWPQPFIEEAQDIHMLKVKQVLEVFGESQPPKTSLVVNREGRLLRHRVPAGAPVWE